MGKYKPVGGEWSYHDLICKTMSCRELEELCSKCESDGCDACFWLAWCCGE